MPQQVNSGDSNNNIFFTMGADSQPGEDSIGGLGGRKMRLIISDTDTNQTSKVSSDSNHHHVSQGVSSNARTVDVAAVLLKDASFLDKAKEFFGLSKRVKVNIDGMGQDVLLNTSSLAKKLGIFETKDLTEEKIKISASLKLHRLTKNDEKAVLDALEKLFSESQPNKQEKLGNNITAAASVKSNPILIKKITSIVLSDVDELAEKIKKPDSLWQRIKGLFQKPPPPTNIK